MSSTTSICAITAAIKKYRPIIKEKKKKHNKIVLSAKIWLDCTKGLISISLNKSYIMHDDFFCIHCINGLYERRNR